MVDVILKMSYEVNCLTKIEFEPSFQPGKTNVSFYHMSATLKMRAVIHQFGAEKSMTDCIWE